MEDQAIVVNKPEEELIDLPPGFRFHPTDEEIISYYLTEKVLNCNFSASAIGEADLNKSEPWDLPSMFLPFLFFIIWFSSPRGRVYLLTAKNYISMSLYMHIYIGNIMPKNLIPLKSINKIDFDLIYICICCCCC